mmetsp:Transcript_77603/g.240443  ORF Transcript_77603/g.240443 Transcript_77603/m.240443 type:complete len:109 (-) Transcript_77603:351-677(-)
MVRVNWELVVEHMLPSVDLLEWMRDLAGRPASPGLWSGDESSSTDECLVRPGVASPRACSGLAEVVRDLVSAPPAPPRAMHSLVAAKKEPCAVHRTPCTCPSTMAAMR